MSRGRPKSLLSRMEGASLEELRNTINYGTPAWRFIRLRELLSDKAGLQPNYLSAVLAALQAQAEARPRDAQIAKACDRLWNELRAQRKGKPPTRSRWLKERDKLLKRLRPHDRAAKLSKQSIEAACLWRELSQQIESALVIGDGDWLNELAKAIRGETSPESGAKFASKVLELFPARTPDATARDIREKLDRLGLVEILDDGKHYKVLDREFGSVADIQEAIHDVLRRIKLELKKQPRPKRKHR